MAVLSVNKESFEKEVLKDNSYVLVDFYAQWCSPCKMLSPIIDEISQSYENRLKCVKIDIDDAQSIAVRYNVASIPTLILFHNGEKKDQSVGVTPKPQIEDLLNKYIQ